MSKEQPTKMWSGRFREPLDRTFEQWQRSFPFDRRLLPHEYQGGTTSISNLGMYGIKSFEAVINPPHATILAVGAVEKRPVVTDDQVAIASIMAATLSCDHRVVDGAVGAELLNAFKTLIEDPVRMLI